MKSEEIYLLCCLVKRYGLNEKFSLKTTEISKEFGVTLRTVSSVFTTLKETECVLIEEPFAIRGRGQYSYTFNEDILVKHDKYNLLEGIIQTENSTILKLLNNDLSSLIKIKKEQETAHGNKSKRTEFRASNRLFLVVLLLHANEFGVIEEFGSTLIRKMMGGISTERFKSQLNALEQVELIKRKISGITGKEIFGRIKGSYYLNIKHPFLLGSYADVSSFLLDFNHKLYEGYDHTEVQYLFGAYRDSWNSKEQNINQGQLQSQGGIIGGLMDEISIRYIIHFFRNQAMHDQIHQWVYQVASELMSHSFTNIESVKAVQCSDKLVKLLSLQKSVPSSKLEIVTNSLGSLKRTKQHYVKHLFLDDVLNIEHPISESASCYLQFVMLIRLVLILGLRISLRYKNLLALGGCNYQSIKDFQIVPIQKGKQLCSKHLMYFIELEGERKDIMLVVGENEEVRVTYSESSLDNSLQLPTQKIVKAFRGRALISLD